MRNLVCFSVLVLVFGVCTRIGAAEGPVAWWKFERLIEERVEEPREEEQDDEESELEEEIEILAEEIVELREEVGDAEAPDKKELQDELDDRLEEFRGLLDELKELRQEGIEVLREEIAEIQAEVVRATGQEKEDLQNDLEEMSEELKEVQAELEELDEEVFLEAEEEQDGDEWDREDEDEEEERVTLRIRTVLDDVSGVQDQICGAYVKIVPGVSGNAIQLDGYTSYILREGQDAPDVSGAFSVEGWVALGAYPTHWCPIVDHSRVSDKGYLLGIDALGHAGFKICTAGKWHEVQSEKRIPLRKWTHLAGVYEPDIGITLYLDGKRIASAEVGGEFVPAYDSALLIGRHSIKRKPYGTLRPHATAAVYTFYDGLLDELKIYNRALSSDEIADSVRKSRPSRKPPLSERRLPSGPPGPGRFGAIYTTLKYYDAWDAPWRVGDHADVVVRFDESPCRFVFWRGTSYIPHWVTENGIWYDNEFNETWSEKGCHEPMSDKRCQHSHVRVIESNDARVVVHWRYALVDNWYNMAKVDELTGWGDWTDEVYTIYPDMVAVRKVTLHSSQPASPHEWHEAIIVMGPGQRPEQVLQPEALTLANMAGKTHTYSWRDGPPGRDGLATEPKGANIHVVNTKSEYKPLVIVSPDSNPVFDIYAGELRREVSMFPWWNHWPTAQKPSDGRYAMDSDLASHSSLSHCQWKPYSQTENSMTKIMLNGLTARPAAELVALAKSWSRPAELKLKKGFLGTDFTNQGYDPTERAYHIACKKPGKPSTLDFELAAGEAQPLVNAAFVVKGWGRVEASLRMDGENIKRGKNFRLGHRHTLQGSDLIVWIKKASTKPVRILLSPVAK